MRRVGRVSGFNNMRQAIDKIRKLFLILVLAINISLGVTRPVAAMPPSPGAESDTGCTYFIPASISEVDGRKNLSEVKPGDTLCLLAGGRGNIKLIHLHGEPGKPITVRNSGGTVTIGGNDFLSGGIGIYASSYLRVTGTGVGNQCGAEYSAAEQKCGIVINGTHKGIKISTTKDPDTLSDIEIDHISVSDVSKDAKTRGIAIHPRPGEFISGLYVHHNYVAGTLAEGIYMGTEPHDQPFETLGKIKNLEVSYNLVEQTGYDGIKVKVAVENVKVHHNVIRDTGLSNTPAHQGGIKVAMSNGQFYNNYIENVFEGINTGRPLDGISEARYFNNIVVNSRSVGIEASEEGALIFNNTVVSCENTGIVGDAKTAKVFNNIVAGCKGKPVIARIGTDMSRQEFNNLVGLVNAIGFVDPAKGNYHLLPDSAAIDVGHIQQDPLTYDYDNAPRPQGKGPDIGAFEYQNLTGLGLAQ
jgi:hypothetical protein